MAQYTTWDFHEHKWYTAIVMFHLWYGKWPTNLHDFTASLVCLSTTVTLADWGSKCEWLVSACKDKIVWLLDKNTFDIFEQYYYYWHHTRNILLLNLLCLQLYPSVSCHCRLKNGSIVTGTLRTNLTSPVRFIFCVCVCVRLTKATWMYESLSFCISRNYGYRQRCSVY